MRERAVFLDRDNTIIANDGYLGDPAKVKLLPGAGVTLASLRRIGYRIIVVSNQSGVARGLFGTADVEAVNQEMGRQLRQQAGALIDANYFCPFHPDAVVAEYRGDHEWRKPRPGMFRRAAADFNLDLPQCWLIGDQSRDIAAGAAVGCRTILLRQTADSTAKNAPRGEAAVPSDFVVKSLADAARIIVREGANVIKEPLTIPPETAAGEWPVANLADQAPVELPEVLVSASSPPPAGYDGPSSAPHRIASARLLLEEITGHVRQLNRRAQPTDFSFGSFIAMIVQMIVVLFLAMALWNGLTVSTYLQTTSGANWWFYRTSAQLAALEWLVAALVLQVAVLGIHLLHRHE